MKQILPAPLSQRTLQLPRPHGIGRTAAFAALAAACCAATAQTVITDDFTNPTNWTTSMQSSPSTDLTVVGGRMNFVTPVVGEEFAGSMWNETLLPADRSWSVRIDAHLDALPMTDPDQFVSVLLGIGWTGNDERAGGGFNFFRHMYTNSFGIEDDFGVDGEDLPNAFYEAGLSSPDVGLRIDYDGAARAFTFWFDADGAAGGSSWVSKGTLEFGPWMDQVGMGPGQTFSVSITGSADLQAVAAGQAWLDNLVTVIGGLPAVTTGSATGVTTTTATLNGTVNPNGTATSAQFEYGLTNAYGSTAAVTLSPDNGSTVQDVSATISGLQAGKTYHYRLTATNSGGTWSGMDMTFATTGLPILPSELVAPKIGISGGDLEFIVQPSVAGRSYQLQDSDTMAAGTWQDLGATWIGNGDELVITIPYVPGAARRFYRLALSGAPAPWAPEGFALIPAGPFLMGDQSDPLVGESDELPVHSVYVSAFYMGKYEVTKEEWDVVRAWGLSNGYTDLPEGNVPNAWKGAKHPVHSINWYAMVKWCNARSQKEGLTPCYKTWTTYKTGNNDNLTCNWSANGYRLPTEAEWEKAARGGLTGKNFPWGDTINHSNANYQADSSAYSYDTSGYTSPTYHPSYNDGVYPYSSAVGSFAPNGYGLYDMVGNMGELCWDWYGSSYYLSSPGTDPRGGTSRVGRVLRGGTWHYNAKSCRVARRGWGGNPVIATYVYGFRLARSSVP